MSNFFRLRNEARFSQNFLIELNGKLICPSFDHVAKCEERVDPENDPCRPNCRVETLHCAPRTHKEQPKAADYVAREQEAEGF